MHLCTTYDSGCSLCVRFADEVEAQRSRRAELAPPEAAGISAREFADGLEATLARLVEAGYTPRLMHETDQGQTFTLTPQTPSKLQITLRRPS